ncbi:hypothetical protein [Lentzea flava]|uniref:Uncharacterized protein n=1 Tax=Lentzea flava TaxID=103732 RepID=A0ABQ2U9Y7_9PSEU|nr:hypothetical protein [Lentzea flava]MCP2196921.1 hypothetical protein [Lentzea flava]GGU14523.1 hypothetical protein GCM10010178_02440 [Lentzea flava]
MPIEQQPGSVEPETQVFAKITTEESPAATIPATTPADAPAPPRQAPARKPKSLTRRIARRILGPTLMTKK